MPTHRLLPCSKGLKSQKTLDKTKGLKNSRKKHVNDKLAHMLPCSTVHQDRSSQAYSDTISDVIDSEEVACTGASPFDNLLKALGSGTKKNSGLYKKRLREQVEESEDDGEEGTDSESSLKDDKENYPSDDGTAEETSDGDYEQDMEINDQATVNEMETTSSFHRHLGRILKDEEVNELNEKKRKIKWEMPATGMPKSMRVQKEHVMEDAISEEEKVEVKPKLYNHWRDIYKSTQSNNFNLSRQKFFLLCTSYQDILHCNKKPFYQRGMEEDSSFMDGYIMHALNHVYQTRNLVTKNDSKLTKNRESKEEEILSDDSFLDQGFTRPKVMFLLPLGSIAFRVVKRLIQLTPLANKANVEHIDRFNQEFGPGDAEDEDEDERNNRSSKLQKPVKPADHKMLFGGNNNDHFMIGIKFTKRSIKLYSDFYSSDIIVASPLGLVTKIGEAEIEKEKDVDYLSSIELLIIDHADVIAMQNWSHLKTVVEQMNHTPSKQHGTDVMRIRQWYLNGHARFYRQTILLGSFLNPDMMALFNHLCFSYEGKVELITEFKGVFPEVLPQVRQIYERYDAAASIADEEDARFAYFTEKVFPKIKDSIEGGTMLFMSSYFELVRMRNFLKSQNASFCQITEYTKQSDISRARNWFFKGERKIVLYTERAHFYKRYKIRGVQNIIVYSLAERKEFYSEIINMLQGSEDMACRIIYSRLDYLRLKRIVGTQNAERMISSDKHMFVFSKGL